MMMWAGLLGWLAVAEATWPLPPDVREEVATDVYVNWTRLTLEISATARGGGTESTRAVEELARREADAGIRQGVGRIAVTSERSVQDLLEVPEFSGPLDARIGRWRAATTQYFRSGKVTVEAELSLVDLLKPYSLATARSPEDSDRPQPEYTGVVIDARGTSLRPAWSPQVFNHKDELLFDGALWESAATERAPVAYVYDPAHRLSGRAGDRPLFLTAEAAKGSDIILGPEDAQRWRTSLTGARILGEGTVVVVVGP